jgi:hypothetical protein
MRYIMIPLAEPVTPYVIEPSGPGFTVRHVGQAHPISWRWPGGPVIYPTRERAEMRVRTACNRSRGN